MLRSTLLDEAGAELAVSNPLRHRGAAEHLPFWTDMHGQSEETIGTNSALRLAEYARDLAFIDAMCHQGNDFQITEAFWQELNGLTRAFNQPGRFVFFPGYEWSGNTALGGDRNVVLKGEGRVLHRSSHALVEDLSDADRDTLDVRALHAVLRARGRCAVPAACRRAVREPAVHARPDAGAQRGGAFRLGHLRLDARGRVRDRRPRRASRPIPTVTRGGRARRIPALRCSAPMAG